jgi:hypothetical protein
MTGRKVIMKNNLPMAQKLFEGFMVKIVSQEARDPRAKACVTVKPSG